MRIPETYRMARYNAVDKLRKPKVEDGLMETNPEPRITHEQFIQVGNVSHSFEALLANVFGLSKGFRCHRRFHPENNRDFGAGTDPVFLMVIVIHSPYT